MVSGGSSEERFDGLRKKKKFIRKLCSRGGDDGDDDENDDDNEDELFSLHWFVVDNDPGIELSGLSPALA